MKLRDYTYLGLTQSLCPQCLQVLPAKIIERRGRVYFRKDCPEHGPREDFVCSDVNWFDKLSGSVPGKLPRHFGSEPRLGCPLDCGLCSEHEQHTCIALFEITTSCNLTCPICFAHSAPGGEHVPLDQCRFAIDELVYMEGQPEVLQLSGGEPTIHPEFFEILDYAVAQPIDMVMVNTNGIRLAKDADFCQRLGEYRDRVEVYLQFDSLDEDPQIQLRGESLMQTKLAAVEAMSGVGLRGTLVCTVQTGVNEDQLGEIVRFAVARPWITGVSFQPTTYTGRYFLPDQLEQRVTFPDVIRGVCEQTEGMFSESDFFPLPCAHPNAHTLTYAYREEGRAIPLTRMIDVEKHFDLIANGILFDRTRTRQAISQFLARSGCGQDEGGCGGDLPLVRLPGTTSGEENEVNDAMARFVEKAITERIYQTDVLRLTTTSFMDAYNFDVRQLMKSCVHHLLPTGHLIPFSAYNVLYRDGQVALPQRTGRPIEAHNPT